MQDKSSFMGCADKPLLRQITDTIGRSLPQAKRPRHAGLTTSHFDPSSFSLDLPQFGSTRLFASVATPMLRIRHYLYHSLPITTYVTRTQQSRLECSEKLAKASHIAFSLSLSEGVCFLFVCFFLKAVFNLFAPGPHQSERDRKREMDADKNDIADRAKISPNEVFCHYVY